MKSRVMLIFCMSLMVVVADSDEEQQLRKSRRAYLDVFRNIPRLFEYLIETLEDKPEVLEKNNVVVFKRSLKNYEVVNDAEEFDDEDDEEQYDSEEYVNGDDNNLNNDLDWKDNSFWNYANPTFKLTPDEVAEQVVKVEQMLEDYNKSK